jgi:translation initiation factor eIF-2B subunit beta
VILSFGYCRTVHLFLREAAKKRRFQVVVAEGGPTYEGQRMARDMANDGRALSSALSAALC